MSDKIQLYPIETPPDEILQAAWEQTPPVKLPEAKKHVVSKFPSRELMADIARAEDFELDDTE